MGGTLSPFSLRDGSIVSLSSREDPDGQSDISSASPEPRMNGGSDRSSVTVLTPPPSTPLPQQEGTGKPTITPSMIRSALESLQQLQSSSKTTPQSGTSPSENSTHSQICPETVASALTVLISQETQHSSSEATTPHLSPPPSTPLGDTADQTNNLSSTDLISALSALVTPSRHSSVGASGENSVVCSVPSCTPNEERCEFLRLGFKPEDVIQALTALSLQSVEDCDSEDTGNLSPIEEERSGLTVDQQTSASSSRTQVRDNRSASQSSMTVDKIDSPGPPDFVFSPPELEDSVADAAADGDSSQLQGVTEGNLIASCSPTDDVLYS